jgi:uncharacterized membrane protein
MENITPMSSQSRAIGAICYLGFFVTGLIFLFVEPYNRDEFIRFHARQSIVFTIAWVAVWIVFTVFIRVMPGPISAVLWGILSIVHILFAVFWVFLMVKAFQGERYRIPELADFADNLGF